MRTTYLLKQLISLILPITVLILVPMSLEPAITISSNPAFTAGLLVIAAGLSMMVVTVYTFITKGNGTLAPWFPTGKLVVTGLYRYVRNPMIIGVLMVLLGESLAILSWSILKWAIIFFLINQAWFLLFEEPSLEKRFGVEYRNYKKRVPRWIPNLQPDKPQANGFINPDAID
jgi:protein-S-isoprenylcysteine O-methyltransferase Ste14